MRERREASPEIVERKANALVLQAGDDTARNVDIGEQRAFRNFNDQPLRGKAGLGKSLYDPLREPAVGQLRRRDIDRDFDRWIPTRCLAKRFADDLIGKPPDEPDFFGDGDEDIGPDDAGERVNPARKSLETDDLAGAQVDLRLKVWNELRSEEHTSELQ